MAGSISIRKRRDDRVHLNPEPWHRAASAPEVKLRGFAPNRSSGRVPVPIAAGTGHAARPRRGCKFRGYGLAARISRPEIVSKKRAELAEVFARSFKVSLVAAGSGDLVERAKVHQIARFTRGLHRLESGVELRFRLTVTSHSPENLAGC
jgi:hypothetical protein